MLFAALFLVGCGDDDPTPSGPGEFPDVRGLWIGQYSVTGCTILSGTDPFFCQDLFYEGSSRFLDLQLNQSRSSVTGTAWQGQVSGGVEGTVSTSGVVTLSGQIGVGEAATTTIEEWEAALVGDSLVGGWTFLFEENSNLGFGSARIDADFTLIDPNVPNFNSCPVELTLAQTDAALGSLEAGDCQLVEDESYYDVFSVDVATGDQLEIRVSSPGFLPVLFIMDLEQRGVACSAPTGTADCTFNNSPDSVATVALEAVTPETWLIIVNTAEGGDVGTYSLTTLDLSGGGLVNLLVHKAALDMRFGIAPDATGPGTTGGSGFDAAAWRFVQPTTRSQHIKRTSVDSHD